VSTHTVHVHHVFSILVSTYSDKRNRAFRADPTEDLLCTWMNIAVSDGDLFHCSLVTVPCRYLARSSSSSSSSYFVHIGNRNRRWSVSRHGGGQPGSADVIVVLIRCTLSPLHVHWSNVCEIQTHLARADYSINQSINQSW